MKSELRFLGVDDSPFTREDENVLVVCILYRGNKSVDGVLSFRVARDGFDATDGLLKAVKSVDYPIACMFINGVSLGGFNVLDLERISKGLGVPVISLVRRKPVLDDVRKALLKVSDFEKHWVLIKKLPPVNHLDLPDGLVYFQCAGVSPNEAREFIKASVLHGKYPECVRVAHLIGAGIVKGKSRGRA